MAEVSFCITCKNRFYQISQTLPKNLADNVNCKDLVEFVLVDFGSRDGLYTWVLDHFQPELESGYLRYFYTEGLPDWKAPLAKNTSHYHSTGRYLVNLDCDNFTGFEGGKYVHEQFLKYGDTLLLHQFDGAWDGGSYGRIAMHRQYFYNVGGYDEALQAMGHEDMDLINRLFEFGLNYIVDPNPGYNRAIKNAKEESVRYSNSKLSWEQMEIVNTRMSRENIYAGRVVANERIFGIRYNVNAPSNDAGRSEVNTSSTSSTVSGVP